MGFFCYYFYYNNNIFMMITENHVKLQHIYTI